ncbi:MAG: sigma 54-interacting transcriptional regulator [bacterium]|nr:sigma 54-interacting transcriptional regulator [bacterium]
MNYFQLLSSWISRPIDESGFDIATLYIDQLLDLHEDDNEASKDFMYAFIKQWLGDIFFMINEQRSVKGQIENETKGINQAEILWRFRQKLIINERSIDTALVFSRETDQNDFRNSVKKFCLDDKELFIPVFKPLYQMARGAYEMYEGSPYTIFFPIPYKGKYNYDPPSIEYLTNLAAFIVSSSHKKDSKKFLIAFEFIQDFNESDKRRFFRAIIRSFIGEYFQSYNLDFQNISILLQSDSEVKTFNSVLGEIIQLLEYHSVENKFDTIEKFFNYHPYYKNKRLTTADLTELDKKAAEYKTKDISATQDTTELSDKIQGEVITSHLKYRRELLKIQNVLNKEHSVLLLGETGTGKGYLAKTIHKLSRGKGKDAGFVEVNCAAIPSELIEAELFGSEKGAYTSSSGKIIGKIELADKGTLFLDEIGKAPLNVQQKLFKVLDDKTFYSVGGKKKKVDVRFIFALNEDPLMLVAKKELLEDFYFRISGLKFTIPPLRERKEDLKRFILFIKNKNEKEFEWPAELPEATMDFLLNLSWPGNIRQIQNTFSQLYLHCKSFRVSKITIDLIKEFIEYIPDQKSKSSFKEFDSSLEHLFLDWYYKRDLFPKVQTVSTSKIKKKNKSHNRNSFLKSVVEPTAADIYIRNFESLGLIQDDATEIIGLAWSSGKNKSILRQRAKLYENIKEIFKENQK